MKPTHSSAPSPDDESLRTSLQNSLAANGEQAGSQALQDRVLAQWQQRHAAPALALAGGFTASQGFRAPRWALPIVLLAISLTLLGWWARPDPALEELMQLDVLSQMALGEM